MEYPDQSIDTASLEELKRGRAELELIKMEHDLVSALMADYERTCNNTIMDDEDKAIFKAKYMAILEAVPLSAHHTGTDAKTGHPRVTEFLAHLASVSPNDTKLAARDLYKQYVDYYVNMGYQGVYMMTENAFGRETKKIPGIIKKRTSAAIFYTLDHAAIRAVGRGDGV
jgi:hypothetical protein